MYVTFSADKLRNLGKTILEAAGALADDAAKVSNQLVESNLAGVDTHGIIRIPKYVARMLGEATFPINPRAKIRTVNDFGAVARIDGDWGFGQVVAARAMDLAIAKAKRLGIGVVTARNCNDIGRLASYPLIAAARGLIGAIFVKTDPLVAPLGGRTRVLGNNPVCFAIPAGQENHIVIDFAISVAAAGKVRLAMVHNEPIPAGWMLDSHGNPTTDPRILDQGGVLLPFGAHKGYGLGVVNEVLGGILSGAGALSDYTGTEAFLAMAVNVGSFMPLSDFTSKVDKLIVEIKSTPKAAGVQEILIPGEPEFRAQERRLKEGIPISEEVWREIKKTAERFHIEISDADLGPSGAHR